MSSPKAPGQIINVASGTCETLLELLEGLAKTIGNNPEPIFKEDRPGDVKHSLASIDKAKELLGYEPTVGFMEGLEKTVDWYRESL